MSRRMDVSVALLALSGALLTLPESLTLIGEAANERRAVSALREPHGSEVLGSELLSALLYDPTDAISARTEGGLSLVVPVSRRSEGEATFDLWERLRSEAGVRRAGLRLVLVEVTPGAGPPVDAREVAIVRVREPETFSMRTGIRAVPFTVIITDEGHVLAAGLGLPDDEFVRAAVDRFLGGSLSGPTTFRAVTPEVNAGLSPLDTFAYPGTSLR